MNVTVHNLPECLAKVEIEVPSETVEERRAEVVKIYSKQAKLPGYRPGKVPAKVVEKRYAKQIREELSSRLIDNACREAFKQEGLEVIRVNGIADEKFAGDPGEAEDTGGEDGEAVASGDEGAQEEKPKDKEEKGLGTFTFTAEITTSPKFELPDYKEIPIRVPKLEVGESDIDAALKDVQQRMAEFNDVEDRALEIGDFAVIKYTGNKDGTPLSEIAPKAGAYIAENDDYWVKIDETSFLPGFCAQLVGLKNGESKTINVVLPEEFPIKDLASQSVEYEVEIKGIKEQILPPIDDAFAAKISDGKNLEEVRAMAQEQLLQSREQQIANQSQEQIINHLTGLMDFELPKEMMKSETQLCVDELVKEAQQGGMDEEQMVERQEEIFAVGGNRARIRLKSSFILQEIAEKEEIKVSREEVAERAGLIAQSQGVAPKKFAKDLQKNNGYSRIYQSILVSKTLDFLKANATVEEFDPAEEPEAPEGA